MARVSIYIKKQQDKEGLCQVYLLLTDKGRRTSFFTGEKVYPKLWNAEKGRTKEQHPWAFDINRNLKEKEDKAQQVLHEMRLNFDFEKAKKKISGLMDRRTKQKEGNLLEKLQEFINISKSTRMPNTIKKFTTLHKLLTEFNTIQEVSFEGLNKEFFESFIDWMMNEDKKLKKSKPLLNNSWSKYLAGFRTFLLWCEESGIKIDPAWRKFKGKTHNSEVHYLTEEELMKLYYYQAPNDRLAQVRDLFCFGCWTGLRYSDLENLSKANIKNDALHIKMIKTKDDVVVPLNQYSRTILEKYNYELPIISNQKANLYLKELCELAGLSTPEKIVKFKGMDRIEETKPKHELISFHDARRTFIILLLVKGVNQRIVMQMSGHSDYRSFEKYVKIADTVTRNEMKRVWG